MANRKLRAGVIGAGIGADHAFAYNHAPEFDLVAVCDVSPQVFDRFYTRSAVARGSIREYLDYHQMLEKEGLDVVSVATPDDYHADPVCDAANAGVKGILCEKPLASNLRDADRMVAAVERNGTKMSVDHTRSWWPTFQAVRQAIRAGEIGGLTRVVAHMGGRRAMLFRNGTHIVDAMGYFADAAPTWVIAAHERGFEDYGTVYHGQGGKDPMLDPGSTVIVEYANGVRGILNGAKHTPLVYDVDLFGPQGRYYLSESGVQAWKSEAIEGPPIATAAPWTGVIPESLGENLIPAVQELARMIGDGVPSSSPPQRARQTLEILLASLLSQSQDSAKIRLPLPRE